MVSTAPTATPTPTAVATATNVIVDGTFEAEGAAGMTFSSWIPCSYPHPIDTANPGTPIPAISSGITASVISTSDPMFNVGKASAPIATVTPAPDTGTYAALTYTGTGAVSVAFPPATTPAVTSGYPNDGADGICQTFTVPQNASLTLDVNTGGDESSLAYGDQEATLFAGTIADLATATPLYAFQELNTQNATVAPYVSGYVAKGPYMLTGAPFNLAAGSTATLFLGTFDTSPSTTYGEYMFIDNVSVVGTPLTSAVKRASSARIR